MPSKKNTKTIERNRRFSKSKLWELQLAAYRDFGPDAWFRKKVPYYLTNNPRYADQYAQIVSGFIRDGLSPDASMPINMAEPIYILDLGAGMGMFAWLFLKSLFAIIKNSFKQPVKIRYILTDVALDNIEFLQRQPDFKEFIKEGILDFCHYYHADKKKSLHLIHSGDTLSKQTLRNPLILIGNYFFDSIPNDMFRVQDRELQEARVTLNLLLNETSQKLALSDPDIIPHLTLSTEYFSIDKRETYYTDDPAWERILKSYAYSHKNFSFLFPVGSLQVIRYFNEMSGGRLMLLAADQGIATEAILTANFPFFSQHDNFSVTVNYHAIASYFNNAGGTSFLTEESQPQFVQMIGISKGRPEHYPQMKEAVKQTLETFDIFEYVRIVNDVLQEWKTPNLEFILKLIKLMLWDPMVFEFFLKRIRELLPDANDRVKYELVKTINQVWNNVYIINKKEQKVSTGIFALNLGVLMYEMKYYDDAIGFFRNAHALGYKESVVYTNLSTAYCAKNDLVAARYWHDIGQAQQKNKK